MKFPSLCVKWFNERAKMCHRIYISFFKSTHIFDWQMKCLKKNFIVVEMIQKIYDARHIFFSPSNMNSEVISRVYVSDATIVRVKSPHETPQSHGTLSGQHCHGTFRDEEFRKLSITQIDHADFPSRDISHSLHFPLIETFNQKHRIRVENENLKRTFCFAIF